MKYYLGPLSVHGFPLLLRMDSTGQMEKYSFITRKWTTTNEYSSIFIGTPEVDVITEKEVNTVIQRY